MHTPIKICPHCQQPARDGDIECLKCGYNFRFSLNETRHVVNPIPPTPQTSPARFEWVQTLLVVTVLLTVLFFIGQHSEKKEKEPVIKQPSFIFPIQTQGLQTNPNQQTGVSIGEMEARVTPQITSAQILSWWGQPYAWKRENGEVTFIYRGSDGFLQVTFKDAP